MNGIWYLSFEKTGGYFRIVEGSDLRAEYEAQHAANKEKRKVYLRTAEGILWDVMAPLR